MGTELTSELFCTQRCFQFPSHATRFRGGVAARRGFLHRAVHPHSSVADNGAQNTAGLGLSKPSRIRRARRCREHATGPEQRSGSWVPRPYPNFRLCQPKHTPTPSHRQTQPSSPSLLPPPAARCQPHILAVPRASEPCPGAATAPVWGWMEGSKPSGAGAEELQRSLPTPAPILG